MENQSLTTTSGALQKSCSVSLAALTPKALQSSCKGIATPLQAADSGMPCMAVLVREYGAEKVEALIKLQLVELNELLNLKRPLTERMIDVIASDIVSDFRDLNMADVWLVFRRARSGHYGELYESLNTAKVEGWFHEYFNERCSAAEEESIRESDQFKLDTRRVSETLREKEHRIAAGAMRIRMEGTPPE
ncbi:MAG: hypothetical protein J6S82_08850 [Bacteroidales bacterium]|nr:hypothetical protein [Bacteroidales bacterium]